MMLASSSVRFKSPALKKATNDPALVRAPLVLHLFHRDEQPTSRVCFHSFAELVVACDHDLRVEKPHELECGPPVSLNGLARRMPFSGSW